jgi:hypothetical protein
LTVESFNPPTGRITPDSPIAIRFDTWIEDDLLLNAATGQLASGGIRTGGYSQWVMTERTLYWTPYGESVLGLRYVFNIAQGELVSVTGSPAKLSALPSYRVTSDGKSILAPDLSEVRWPEVKKILEANCSSCHGDPQWKLNPLSRNSLIGVRSEQVDRFLVRPGDAADSYLMEKIIPNYPRRQGTVQPPPWSGLSPLSKDEILRVERWILAGAPP